MKKLFKIISSIVPFFCALLIQIIVVLVFAVKVAVDFVIAGETDAKTLTKNMLESLNSDSLVLSAFIASVCLLLFGLWYRKLRKGEEKVSITRIFTWKRILILIILGITLQIGISALLTLITIIKPEWFENYNNIIKTLGMGNSAISFLYIAFIGPISEELIFRGVILEKGRRAMPFIAANIVQALLFGVYHGNLVQGLYAFGIGMFLGLVRIKYNTILASILLHMIINICGIFMDQILNGKIFNTIIAMAIMAVLSIAAIIYCTKNIMGIRCEEKYLNIGRTPE